MKTRWLNGLVNSIRNQGRYLVPVLLFLTVLLINSTDSTQAAGPKLEPRKGRFLVATENLSNTSFKNTVILMTHFSSSFGAQGITINRPANIPIKEVFPEIKELKKQESSLYLGGPVRTNAIFVLMQTQRPHEGMQQVLDNIYFSVGVGAIAHGLDKAKKGEFARAYAGYAGWGPGQLQNEIERGDWIIVEADPNIVFEENTESIWEKLHQSWSGNWI